jgi:hypothetical protein
MLGYVRDLLIGLAGSYITLTLYNLPGNEWQYFTAFFGGAITLGVAAILKVYLEN